MNCHWEVARPKIQSLQEVVHYVNGQIRHNQLGSVEPSADQVEVDVFHGVHMMRKTAASNNHRQKCNTQKRLGHRGNPWREDVTYSVHQQHQ